MVSIKWCLSQKDGLRIIEPNENVSKSYICMAEESISVLKNIGESRIWSATTAYYVFYYSLYALMLRIGVKCGIHSCSIGFMKKHLSELYSKIDIEMFEKSFSARIDLQYYSNRPVDDGVINETKKYCVDFFVKTKDILSKIGEEEINEIRRGLNEN
jgi:uncharacterized protein (UPF0332 family)